MSNGIHIAHSISQAGLTIIFYLQKISLQEKLIIQKYLTQYEQKLKNELK